MDGKIISVRPSRRLHCQVYRLARGVGVHPENSGMDWFLVSGVVHRVVVQGMLSLFPKVERVPDAPAATIQAVERISGAGEDIGNRECHGDERAIPAVVPRHPVYMDSCGWRGRVVPESVGEEPTLHVCHIPSVVSQPEVEAVDAIPRHLYPARYVVAGDEIPVIRSGRGIVQFVVRSGYAREIRWAGPRDGEIIGVAPPPRCDVERKGRPRRLRIYLDGDWIASFLVARVVHGIELEGMDPVHAQEKASSLVPWAAVHTIESGRHTGAVVTGHQRDGYG